MTNKQSSLEQRFNEKFLERPYEEGIVYASGEELLAFINQEIENAEKKTEEKISKIEQIRCDEMIRDMLEERDKKIKELITEEMLICRKEGTPTSRLTSLFMKITSLNKTL